MFEVRLPLAYREPDPSVAYRATDPTTAAGRARHAEETTAK
jgi:hypothetical protein